MTSVSGLLCVKDPGVGGYRPGAWSDWLESNVYDDIADIPDRALRRFYSAPLERVPTTGCLIWPGTQDKSGYGDIKVVDEAGRHRHFSAHRISYLLAHGAIAPSLVLDHLCRTRHCVNPDHLEAVSNRENVQRGRPLHQTECKHGHPLSGGNVYLRPAGGRGCRACRLRRTRASQARRKQAA